MSDNEYRTKLKAQLDKLVVSKELIKQIRENAFRAKVFVSYRKHELVEVRRFMKVFHDLEGFESISIAYDNFLTAGEDFNNEIKELIAQSSALVLVVTPDLTIKGNYVQEIEYPFALEKKMPIVPVEVTPIFIIGIKIHDPFPRRDNTKIKRKVIMNLHKYLILGI